MANIGQKVARRNFVSSGRKKNAIVRACQTPIETLEERRLLSNGISVNFNGGGQGRGADLMNPADVAGVVPLSNFNNFDTGANSNAVFDNTGTFPAAGTVVSYTGGGVYSSVNNTATPTPGDEVLNTGFVYGDTTVQVFNVPYQQYDVYVYELNDASGRVETTTLNGVSYYGKAATPNDANHIDGNAATPYLYTQTTSTNPNAPTTDGDYVLFKKVTGANFTFTTHAPGNGYLNGFQIVEDLGPADVPSNVQGQAAINSATISWNNTPGATAYTVLRSTTSGAETTLASGVTGLNYVDNTAVNGTQYFYKVVANGLLGDSAPSAEVSVTPGNVPPSGVTTKGSLTTVTVNWNAVTGASSYNVKRSGTPNGTYTTLASNVTGTSFVDNTAGANTTYYYEVSTNAPSLPESANSGPVAGNIAYVGNGDGWSAQYFADNVTAAGTPTFQKVDPTINLIGPGEPNGPGQVAGTGVPASFNTGFSHTAGANFSIRWEANVEAQYSEQYTLYVGTDDGVRVIVDGVVQEDILTVGRGIPVPPDTLVVKGADGNPIPWVAGSKHDIVMQYQEGGGGWGYQLAWGSPSTPQQIIPQSQAFALVPTSAPAPFTSAVNSGTVILNWGTLPVDNYTLVRGDSASGPFVPVLSNTTATTYTDTGLTNGHQYFYQLVGNVAAGTSPIASLSATPALQAPGQATGVQVGPASGFGGATTHPNTTKGVTVTWTATPFATAYNVQRGPVGGPYATIATGVTTTSYFDNTVTAGNIYEYKVIATNASGAGPASAAAKGDLFDGVTVHYYNNSWWNSPNQSTTGYTQTALTGFDATVPIYPIDDVIYNTDTKPPDTNLPADNWSTVVTGKVVVKASDAFAPDGVTLQPIVFVTDTDDDGYLFVNGQLVASDPGGHGQRNAFLGGTAGTATQMFLAPGTYDFIQFMHEGGGGAGHRLKWITHYSGQGAGSAVDVPAGNLLAQTGAPLAPTNLTGFGAPGSGVSLTWQDNATNELQYVIQRSTTPNFAPGTVQTVGSRGLSDNAATPNPTFTDTGNVGIQTTYYRVIAVNYEGKSTASNVLTVTPFVAPQTGVEEHFFNNEWWNSADQSTTAPVTQGASVNADANLIASSVDGSSAVTPAPATGISAAPFSSVFTGQFTVTDGSAPYTFPTQSDDDSYLYVDGQLASADPGGHGNRTAPTVNPLTLAPGIHYYQFFQSQGGGGWDFHLLYSGPDTGNTAVLMPLSVMNSAYSDNLVAPGALTFTNVTSGSATINWGDTNNSEIQYVIERSTDNFVNNVVQVGTTGLNGSSINDTGLSPNTPYQYRIHAVNFDMVGAYAMGSVTTPNIASGGSITATKGSIAPQINLTTLGTLDWAHWGLNDANSYDHKGSATQHISNLTAIGAATKSRVLTNPVSFTWSDGTPDGAFNNTTSAIFTSGVGNGFEFSVPASTTNLRVAVYVGVLNATGTLTAHFSDGSATPLTATTLDATGTTPATAVYTINYKSGTDGQLMFIDWTETADHGGGAIAIGGAVLENTTDFAVSAYTAVNSVSLSWVGPVTSTAYDILRGPVGGPYATIASGVTGSGYVDNTAVTGNIYEYKVVANNGGPTTAPVTADLKNGVSARYVNNEWWRSSLQNTNGQAMPGLTGIDATAIYPSVNQIYGVDAPPVVGIQADNWSDVITGKIVVTAADALNGDGVTLDPIAFVNNSDDDGYIYVDGKLVASEPGGHGMDQTFLGGNPGTPAPITLAPGVHDFIVFHSEGGGGAGAVLKWITHYNGQAANTSVPVPAGQFLTLTGVPTAPDGLTATFTPNVGATLTWNDNATNELRYVLERSTTPNFASGTVSTFNLPLHDNTSGTQVNYTDVSNSGLQKVYYRLTAVNFEGSSATTAAVPLDTFALTQPGAEAHFYNSTWWGSGFANGDLAGGTTGTVVNGASVPGDVNAVYTTVDQGGADPATPIAGVGGNNFSVVFTGQVNITTEGDYTFPTQSDDDSYCYVDGVLVASDPKPHGIEVAPNLTTIHLTPGAHNFQFFVSQQGGGWDFHLYYNGPDTGNVAQIIPQSAMTTLSSPVVAPGAITFSNVTANSVKINWGDTNTSEIRYVVERSSDNFATDDEIIGTTGINGTSFTDTNVPAGNFTYRVHAINFDSTGPAVTKLLDHVAPTVTASAYQFAAHPPTATITFSEDVSASLASSPIVVANLTAGGSVPYTLTYNSGNNTATLHFAGVLADGNYRISVPTTVTDAAGNPLAALSTTDFFSLKGDVDRDRSVGFSDLVAVAQNYGGTGKTYAQGDLDGDGSTGFSDLVEVAQNYGKTLAPPSGSGPVAAPAGDFAAALSSLGFTGSGFKTTTPVTTPVKPVAVTPAKPVAVTPPAKPVAPVVTVPPIVTKPVVVTKPVIVTKPTASAFSTTRIASTVVKKKNDLFN